MSLPHYGALKILYGVGVSVVAVWVVIDPTFKAFLYGCAIVSLPPTITGLFNYFATLRLIAKVDKVETNTNSMNTELRKQAVASATRADISEGSEAGRQLARAEAAADKAKS